MQLEHRIGQLLIIGLPGARLDAADRELLEVVQPGGVLLKERNIEDPRQLTELTAAIRSAVRVPPLIAIDQEGGRVDRLKKILTPMPSADLLRAANDASIAARLGEITAEALHMLGFNINFAPVLDVCLDDAAENGLRGRCLGSTPAEVIRLGGAYLEGLQRGGIIGVGKHFPGLGGSTVDSHDELPRIDLPRNELLRISTTPYAELFGKISARLVAVIVAHAHYPALDGPSALPASLSKNVVGSLLREEMSFKGMAITDDLEMGAITSTRNLKDAAPMAVEAGIDMVMVAGSSEGATTAWEAMIAAYHEGRITRTHISRAFDHIARIKSMLSPPQPLNEQSMARLRDRIAELNLVLQHSR